MQQNMKISDIEKRLLEIDEEKARRIFNMEDDPGSFQDIEGIEEIETIKSLDREKGRLISQRQFILDERNSGWKSKIIWSIFVPIMISIITNYFLRTLIYSK